MARLINRLCGAEVGFFVHIDKNVDVSSFRKTILSQAKTDKITWIPSMGIERYSWKVLFSAMNALKTAHQSSEKYDYFIWLSGQDYPIRSNQVIQEYLGSRNGISFVKSIPLPKSDWKDGGLDRVRRYYFNIGKYRLIFPAVETSRYRKLINFFMSFWFPYPRLCPEGVTFRGGSAWFCLHRSAVEALLIFIKQRPDVVRFFQTVFNPDEMFIQSLLPDLIPDDQLEKRSLTFVSWERSSKGHPDILTKDDYERLISADALFARKFDPEIDDTILDMLDAVAAKPDHGCK